MKPEVILGLHGFSADSRRQMHDAGVCLMVDGEVVAAIDEERLSRAKRDGNFPFRSFEAAMKMAGIGAGEIDTVAFVDRLPLWQTWFVWRYAMEAAIMTGVRPWGYLGFWTKMMREWRRVPPVGICTKDIRYLEHHRCHAATAYYPSPWDKATVVTLDGMGDFSIGGSVSRGGAGKLDLLRRSNGYFSPGHFYMIVTEYLGFVPGRHEGKVTGLAARGDPGRAYAQMEQIISYRKGKLDFVAGPVAEEFFNVIRGRPGTRTRQWHSQDQWDSAKARIDAGYVPDDAVGLDYFRRAWAGCSREDIAAAAQKRFEDVISEYVADAVNQVGEKRLVLAGGCFANVRLNQRLATLPGVDGIYVHPNMSDGGLASGAALLAYHERRNRRGGAYLHNCWPHVYLGPSWDDAHCRSILEAKGIAWSSPPDFAAKAAAALADGKVIAWFQGRMEYGPRALGNRTLLAAATDPEMPARLNGRLKRSDFMPFAPIILDEHAAEWLVGWEPDHIASRFMTITYDLEPALSSKVPAVVHIDGTARPQVLRSDDHPCLHAVLSEYHRITGIPMVINTSFNMHEDPIVCSPEDAIDAVARGAADVLVLGSLWVECGDVIKVMVPRDAAT